MFYFRSGFFYFREDIGRWGFESYGYLGFIIMVVRKEVEVIGKVYIWMRNIEGNFVLYF